MNYQEKYRIEHRQHKREYDKKWHEENKQYKNSYSKQWRKDNPEYSKIYLKQYRKNKPNIMHQIDLKHWNKRERDLGFYPLNEYFKGSEAHHISQNFVIYIPEKIHKSIWHCLWTWRNMELMNKLAIEFL